MGTFVSTSPVEISVGTGPATVRVSDGLAEERVSIERRAVQAVSTNGFFVILTIQRSTPPEVKMEGNGATLRAVVGRQSVSFDGEKSVFGLK